MKTVGGYSSHSIEGKNWQRGGFPLQGSSWTIQSGGAMNNRITGTSWIRWIYEFKALGALRRSASSAPMFVLPYSEWPSLQSAPFCKPNLFRAAFPPGRDPPEGSQENFSAHFLKANMQRGHSEKHETLLCELLQAVLMNGNAITSDVLIGWSLLTGHAQRPLQCCICTVPIARRLATNAIY